MPGALLRQGDRVLPSGVTEADYRQAYPGRRTSKGALGAGESPHPPYRVMIARADRRWLSRGHGGLRAQPRWYQGWVSQTCDGAGCRVLLVFGGQAPVSDAIRSLR